VSLGQGLYQKQLQKLSPQQIQLMKLLQVPTANLEERIQEEIEENPALEIAEQDENDEETQFEEFELDLTKDETTTTNDVDDEKDFDETPDIIDEPLDLSEYINEDDDEIPDYKTKEDYSGGDEQDKTIPIRTETSFNELMIVQLNLLTLTDEEKLIAEHIIGSLDDDGYLRRETTAIADDLAFKQGLIVTEKEVEKAIKLIQEFDPPGLAARNLQECLIIQLKKKEDQIALNKLSIKILTNYFDEFTKKHYEKIQKGLSITAEELKQIIEVISKLNPKPASDLGDNNRNESYVIPDFFISSTNGKLELSLNGMNAPELRVSSEYKTMLKEYEQSSKTNKEQKEAVTFIKQKIDSAKWFIDAIQQRQNTLLLTMNAIMRIQESFFSTGDEMNLKPMILKDIAEITNLDISTVSRVANSKYVQTEFGTYLLKYFFSESISTDSGEEVSTREVKKILNDLINSEDKNKPLSDEALTDALQEKGYNIARRTIAKYREQLNLPVARLRREL
jgi:RNA polymerase sigma-54 factor